MIVRKTLRSCTGSAFALTAAEDAGVVSLVPPRDIVYSHAPSPATAAITKRPIHSRFDPVSFPLWVSSNISSSFFAPLQLEKGSCASRRKNHMAERFADGHHAG